MENLIFSLNATMPIFLTMILGLLFRKVGILDEAFTEKLNRFVFKIALPVLLFSDLSDSDFFEVWDTRFVLFCFAVTLVSILAVWALSFCLKNRSLQGEFIQASYRSSAAILGIAFIQNIYGNSGMAPLMIISSVPLYNIMAVVVLSVFSPQREPLSRQFVEKTVKGIVTNPIILGILAGLVWSLLRIPKPPILAKTVQNLAVLATPLGLISMGASFKAESAAKNLKPGIVAALIKLVGLAAVFLPIAVALGFREEKLIAILVMLGSATTVTCFVMAKNMGHEGSLTANTVMLTTCGSAFTLTFWLYLLKTLALI
ncbi:MAG: AEC family transporter [Fusicatenibacter sp.]|nr:AEC family transporter [Lachnospiraceae bacterium]MDY2937465.1 AEC family transporter [Fusicatenibacter sp.]